MVGLSTTHGAGRVRQLTRWPAPSRVASSSSWRSRLILARRPTAMRCASWVPRGSFSVLSNRTGRAAFTPPNGCSSFGYPRGCHGQRRLRPLTLDHDPRCRASVDRLRPSSSRSPVHQGSQALHGPRHRPVPGTGSPSPSSPWPWGGIALLLSRRSPSPAIIPFSTRMPPRESVIRKPVVLWSWQPPIGMGTTFGAMEVLMVSFTRSCVPRARRHPPGALSASSAALVYGTSHVEMTHLAASAIGVILDGDRHELFPVAFNIWTMAAVILITGLHLCPDDERQHHHSESVAAAKLTGGPDLMPTSINLGTLGTAIAGPAIDSIGSAAIADHGQCRVWSSLMLYGLPCTCKSEVSSRSHSARLAA